MAEGGDSVDCDLKSNESWRKNKVSDIQSSLNLGSTGVEPMLCREHEKEFKHFCKNHMTELCITCRRMEHKNCKSIIDITEAAENIYSNIHGKKITKSVKDLSERFNDFMTAAENLKNKLPNKRQIALDELKQARKDLDDYLDTLQARAVADIDQNLQDEKKALEEKIHVCEASISSLKTRVSDIERTMSVGNKEEMFITINRATIQTNQYCDILLELNRELSEMNVNFEPTVTFPDIFKSLGTVSVEMSKVTDVFTNTTTIYTGELEVKRSDVGGKAPLILTLEVLQDGRKLALARDHKLIQLYDEKNTFVTETVLPFKEHEECRSLVLNNNKEALIATNNGQVFEVIIDDKLAVRETKTNYRIYAMTKYGGDNMCAIYDSGQRQICIIDKNTKSIVKTILKDVKKRFKAPIFLGANAERNTVYVLDAFEGIYGITVDGQVMFHYQNPEADFYHVLVVDSDGLFIDTQMENKHQVEKINFSGEQQEVCTIFGNAWPLRLMGNELAVFQCDKRSIGFYCLLK